MKRAPIVLAATVAGVAGTLGFQAQNSSTSTTAAAVSTTDTGTANAASGSTGSSSTTTASSSSGSTTQTASSTKKTVTSDAIQTQYGAVQVKVTFTDGKVTAVENVALPQNDPHSSQISASVGPTLQQSALSNADGTVDAVSGATYTSNGYAQALQSALDKAGLASTTSSSSSSTS